MIIKWPEVAEGGRYEALHYHIDITATILELAGKKVPASWDGVSFADALTNGRDEGRDELIVSQAAWSCQRGVRFDNWLYLHTQHDAYHLWPRDMLFNIATDPHQQNNLALAEPDVLQIGRDKLTTWHTDMLVDAARGRDPHDNVMQGGGPYHVRGELDSYLERLRATDRSMLADQLAAKYNSS